jgi:hypothetical protein
MPVSRMMMPITQKIGMWSRPIRNAGSKKIRPTPPTNRPSAAITG